MKRKFLDTHSLRHTLPFAAACFTASIVLFACADKDVETNDNNGKALVTFNVSAVQSKAQDQAKAAAKAGLPMTRTAFANQLALQNLTPEDLTMQKLPVQGAAASSDICLIETTVAGVPSQWEDGAPTRANITTMPTMQNFSTTAFYGSSDTSLEPWFYDKDTKKDGNLVTPIYWDWIKNHACFYAVYPKPDNNKIKLSPASYAGTPYVDFEVEPNVTNQKDLMTACSGNVHLDAMGTAPRTDLTFRHALTAVRFKVGQNLSYSKHITKVEIVGTKSKGKYTLPTDKNHTGAWDASTLSAPATFTLSGVNVSTSEAVNNIIMGHNQDNYVFYMIPQTLTGVQVKVFFSDGSTPITANLTGTWKPGTTKTYALSQNTSDWSYVLNVVSPTTPAAYNQTAAGNYTIQSYRQSGFTLQPVKWKVVGYQESTDGGANWSALSTTKPAWLTSLSKESGDGSESGAATVQAATLVDKLAPRNNALKAATAKGSAGNYYDLSTHDYEGNSTNRNTANCYLIFAPGYYKIPLVYGNAIKNGSNNPSSYQASVSGTSMLQHFKDHNDIDITDPWITKSNGGNNAPDNARLVWADENGLVTNLSVTGSGTNAFVQFEVPAANIKNGNAVIAVTKGGTVVWSWHLWFAPQDVLGTVTCTNFQGHEYKFTQETLGWKYTAWSATTYSAPRSVKVKVKQTVANGGVKKHAYITITQNNGTQRQGYSTLYQFGRKDALPGTDAIPQGNYSFDNTYGGRSLGYAIQHPENMFRRAETAFYYGDWCNVGYYNLWSMDNTVYGWNDNAVVKTIYDPCPAGFHMPASNAFTGFTTTGIKPFTNSQYNIKGGWDHGWDFNNKISHPNATVWFPAWGYRNYNDGSLIGVGDLGSYWSAVPGRSSSSDLDCGCSLSIAKWLLEPRSAPERSWACAVRPVADN